MPHVERHLIEVAVEDGAAEDGEGREDDVVDRHDLRPVRRMSALAGILAGI